jgi:RNA polymerase sigma factor (sigma-70 family)
VTEASTPIDETVTRDTAAAWDAIEPLYLECEASSRTLITLLVGSPDDVEDVLHNATLKAVHGISQVREDPRKWFRAIVANAAIDQRRKRRRQSLPTDDPVQLATLLTRATPKLSAYEHALYRDVLNFIYTKLNDRQRVAILLVCLLGWSYKDAASHIGCTVNAVGVVLDRAKNKIRKHYDIDLDDSSGLQEQIDNQGSGA